MSRVGKLPIKLPSGVTLAVENGQVVVNGSKGSLTQSIMAQTSVAVEGEEIQVSRANEEREARANHGLMRALIQNMVTGVSAGFEKKLEVNGVGYRVNLAGADLKMNLGLSHEVVYKIPEDISVTVEQNSITITGISKQRVGQVAAEIRALKKPEPYKGKGIMYTGERIIRKSGKSGKEK